MFSRLSLAIAPFTGPCAFHWPLHLSLAFAPFTGPCAFHWPLCLSLAFAPFAGLCAFHWPLRLSLALAPFTGLCDFHWPLRLSLALVANNPRPDKRHFKKKLLPKLFNPKLLSGLLVETWPVHPETFFCPKPTYHGCQCFLWRKQKKQATPFGGMHLQLYSSPFWQEVPTSYSFPSFDKRFTRSRHAISPFQPGFAKAQRCNQPLSARGLFTSPFDKGLLPLRRGFAPSLVGQRPPFLRLILALLDALCCVCNCFLGFLQLHVGFPFDKDLLQNLLMVLQLLQHG